ncbi:MAG: lysophospholipid acyltransferase family protein [Victivallaceae bacterium]
MRGNKTIAILADQHASSNEGVETTFFGQPCRTHTSPSLLHLKTGIPIMPEITRRVDDKCNFEFIVADLIKYEPTGDKEKDIRTVTQMYTTALEKMIAQYPEQWMWVHRRWLNIHRRYAMQPPPGSEDSRQNEQSNQTSATA